MSTRTDRQVSPMIPGSSIVDKADQYRGRCSTNCKDMTEDLNAAEEQQASKQIDIYKYISVYIYTLAQVEPDTRAGPRLVPVSILELVERHIPITVFQDQDCWR